MTRLARDGDAIELIFDDGEGAVLGDLAAQVAELLAGDRDADPALRRLLPDGYRDDDEAAAEFARWTRTDLAAAKADTARDLADTLAGGAEGSGPRTVRLGHDRAERWTRGLTDLRLTLAERLGLRSDDDRPALDGPGALYWWLGELQEALVLTLDRWDAEDADGAGAR